MTMRRFYVPQGGGIEEHLCGALVMRADAEAELAIARAEGYREGLEAAAKLSEGFTAQSHIAQDMKSGIFPSRSDRVDAVAAAIRAMKVT